MQCIVLCCEERKCDVAFRVKGTCYLVNCKNTYLCQPVVALNPSLTPEISYVAHNPPQKQNNEPKLPSFPTATIYSPPPTKLIKKPPKSKQNTNNKEQTPKQYQQQKHNSGNSKLPTTLRVHTSHHKLSPLSPHKPKFHLASMNSQQNGDKRVTIHQKITKKPIVKPIFFFDQQKHKISKQQQQHRKLSHHTLIDDGIAANGCYPTKIHNSVSLQYGPDAGEFYDYGNIGKMEECVDLCCEDKQCDVAFMVGETCYTVSCYVFEKCRMIPASKHAKLTSKLAYVIKKSDKEKDNKLRTAKRHEMHLHEQLVKEKELEQKLLLATQPDSNIPLSLTKTCKYSTLKRDHTLIGGSKAGIFNYRGKTPGFQACLDLCCTDTFCDAALLLGRKCYSVQCYKNNSCESKEVRVGKLHSILAFIKRGDDVDVNESK